MAAGEPTNRTMTRRLMSLDPILWVAAFVYLWLGVQPELLYHAFGSLLPGAIPFCTSKLFASETFSMPAAGVVYLTGLLSQGYADSLLGASIITLAAFLLAELTRLHVALAGIRRGIVLASVPAVAYVVIVSQYYHPLAACLTVLMGLLFSLLFEKVPCHRTVVRMGIYCLVVGVGYAVMGAGGVGVFSLMTAVHWALTRRRVLPALFVVPAAGVFVWVLSQYVYLLPYKKAFLTATPFAARMTVGLDTFSTVLVCTLYAFAPVVILAIGGGKVLLDKVKPTGYRPAKKKGHAQTQAPKPIVVWAKSGAALLFPTALLVAGLLWSHNGLRRSLFQINAAARQEHWSEVIERARALPKGRNHISCNHDIDRALYHTGRLAYEMFSYPQDPHALLLTQGGEPSAMTQIQLSEVHAELGNVNTAEKMASEFLVVQGSFAPVVEELAWINIFKGQNETARVYLNALKQYPGYHDKAKAMLDGLDRGFDPNQAAYIARIQSSLPRLRYDATYGGAVEPILVDLLEQNPHNKMAFEYLMACYLLTGQVQKVAANMKRLADLGYKEVPTHYQEAMLVYYGSLGQKVDLAKLGVTRAVYERYLAFVQLERSMQSTNRQAALSRLIQEFGQTYYFYFRFGRVGAV